MLDRQHGKIIFECDACGEVLESDTNDFAQALTVLRRRGWGANKLGTDWIHRCSGCAEKPQRDSRARAAGRIP